MRGDCGLFQGTRTLEARNREPFGFRAVAIEGVIVPQAHIDHSGLLPRLAAAGYQGPAFCTAATRDLFQPMPAGAGRVQEGEAERRNRRADRADEERIAPLYTEADALTARPGPGGRLIGNGSSRRQACARLWNAGHTLGSASVELEIEGLRLLFSGDLGPDNKTFHSDPEAPAGFDHVVCEATYGDRARTDSSTSERRALLEAEIRGALAAGGSLIIPVFALERTQELLLDIACLIDAGRVPGPNVFSDSPLAARATEVFARHQNELEDMACGDVFRNPAFHYVGSAAESMRLDDMSGAIILADSGCGRPDASATICCTIWHDVIPPPCSWASRRQARSGRTILDGAERVRISGRDVAVRARIRRIDSHSAHADQADLLRWILAGRLFLNHGGPDAATALDRLIAERAGPELAIIEPRIGERSGLEPAVPARRLETGRAHLYPASGHDWQNDYAAFASRLKKVWPGSKPMPNGPRRSRG